MRFCDVVATQMDELQALLRLRALLAQVLSLGGGEVGEKIFEGSVVAVLPMELLVGSQQQAGLRQHGRFVRRGKIDVERR